MFLVIAVVNFSVVILVVFGFAGSFHQLSVQSLFQLKQRAALSNCILTSKERKYIWKFLRSCQVGKMRFGFSKFIEKSTPPTFQSFCVDRLID